MTWTFAIVRLRLNCNPIIEATLQQLSNSNIPFHLGLGRFYFSTSSSFPTIYVKQIEQIIHQLLLLKFFLRKSQPQNLTEFFLLFFVSLKNETVANEMQMHGDWSTFVNIIFLLNSTKDRRRLEKRFIIKIEFFYAGHLKLWKFKRKRFH